jgi:hypothetical protein
MLSNPTDCNQTQPPPFSQTGAVKYVSNSCYNDFSKFAIFSLSLRTNQSPKTACSKAFLL